MVASRTLDPLAPSRFWETEGVPPTERDVSLCDSEGLALKDYFLGQGGMLEDTELQRITRVENRTVWRQFKVYRNEVYEQFRAQNWNEAGIELWLWHGSNDVESIVRSGFDMAHPNRNTDTQTQIQIFLFVG